MGDLLEESQADDPLDSSEGTELIDHREENISKLDDFMIKERDFLLKIIGIRSPQRGGGNHEEDIYQSLYIKLRRHIDRYPSLVIENIKGFVLIAAERMVFDFLRSHARRRENLCDFQEELNTDFFLDTERARDESFVIGGFMNFSTAKRERNDLLASRQLGPDGEILDVCAYEGVDVLRADLARLLREILFSEKGAEIFKERLEHEVARRTFIRDLRMLKAWVESSSPEEFYELMGGFLDGKKYENNRTWIDATAKIRNRTLEKLRNLLKGTDLDPEVTPEELEAPKFRRRQALREQEDRPRLLAEYRRRSEERARGLGLI